jgi:acyl-CoA dehydrogenase
LKFSAEHELFRDSVRAFVANEIAPHINAWDEAQTFPRELYRRASQMSLLGMGYPEELAARRPTPGFA